MYECSDIYLSLSAVGYWFPCFIIKVKVKLSLYRPGQALRASGGCASLKIQTIGTQRW